MVSEKEVPPISMPKFYGSESSPPAQMGNNSLPSFSKLRSQFKNHSFPSVTTNTSTFQKDARSKFIERFSDHHR
jgi:hypothetical protein